MKLIRCLKGAIWDVAVDLRNGSPTFLSSFGIRLAAEELTMLVIPEGFAHGFQVISDEAIVNYKVDEYYNPDSDCGIIWNDQNLLIDWNYDTKPILSNKDSKLISFKELKSPF